jgi:hypothetical protein
VPSSANFFKATYLLERLQGGYSKHVLMRSLFCPVEEQPPCTKALPFL